jgi:uncharacterized phage-associated protein
MSFIKNNNYMFSSNNTFTKEQVDKLGNAIRFFTEAGPLSKTKLLKLIYLLEEISVKKHGIPFFNFRFDTWKFGPVIPDIFIEFSTKPSILKDYIERFHDDDDVSCNIKGVGDFSDDEFSDNDLKILEFVNANHKDQDTNTLINLTHRENSPWYIAAKRNNVLELLMTEQINKTDIPVDIISLVNHDPIKKVIYLDYLDHFGSPIKKDCECSIQEQ